MRGRKPQPTALKVLRGNPGKRPLNTREPIPDPISEEVPTELSAADAIAEWHRTIVPGILRRQITAADRVFAIAHCELWSTWRSQLAEASKYAHIVAIGKDGKPTPNPARQMANRTLMLLAKVDSELGLTPVSRARVQTAEADTPADHEKWAGLLG